MGACSERIHMTLFFALPVLLSPHSLIPTCCNLPQVDPRMLLGGPNLDIYR